MKVPHRAMDLDSVGGRRGEGDGRTLTKPIGASKGEGSYKNGSTSQAMKKKWVAVGRTDLAKEQA